MIMLARRITTFLAAAGLFSIASIALLAKEKAGTPAKEKAGSGPTHFIEFLDTVFQAACSTDDWNGPVLQAV